MGMDNMRDNDDSYIQNYLEQFDTAMDFVMITERFSESILMMRKLLCMDFLDLYVQPKKVKVHESFEFSTKQKIRFYEFNNMDLTMYTVSAIRIRLKLQRFDWLKNLINFKYISSHSCWLFCGCFEQRFKIGE